jgi:DNA-binding CsgD family transcriptional regulator
MSWDLGAVERAFAEAALDPSQWNVAMDAAAAVTGSVGAVLLPIRGRIPGVPCSESIAPMIDSYFRGGWAPRDERERGLRTMMRRGVFTDLDFTDADEIKRHPYYQELLAPHDLRWFGGLKISFGDDVWCLAIQRSISQGPFLSHDVRALALLADRIGSAAALAHALNFARTEAALDAFEVTKSAVLMLDRKGEAVRLNRAAEKLLHSGVKLRDKRLVSFDRHATAALDRAVHDLINGTTGSALQAPIALSRHGRLPLLAYPLRLSGVTVSALAECQCVIVLIDPAQKRHPPEKAIQAALGLTAAEARVAARLANGETIERAADSLGITKATVRNQLKAVFAKTGVHRQAELVSLITAMLGPFAGT